MSTSKKQKTLLQWLIAIFAMVFLGVVATMFSVTSVFAAVGGSLSDTGIGLTDDGGTWSASGQEINGSATGSSGCSASAGSGKLTIKNNKGNTGTLSFDYELTLNGGTISIDGASKTSNGSFSKELANNGTVVVQITTQEGDYTSSIKMTNVKLVVDIQTTTNFAPSSNGYYSVVSEDGAFSQSNFSSTVSWTQSSAKAYTLTPYPASGYKFVEWQKNGAFLSNVANLTLNQDTNNATISCLFALSSSATYLVGSASSTSGTRYYDLQSAISASSSSNNKITVIGSGTVPAGNYTIPSNVTLLLPMNSSYGIVKDTPTMNASHVNPTAFVTLTMANGANITFSGSSTLCLASDLSRQGQNSAGNNWNGTPSGPDGRIKMESGSSIKLNSGSTLYCWGYIYGSGLVEAMSGSTVYECFQLKDFRGGTCTTNMNNNSNKVFFFNQYYVQNIECTLKLNAGATEKLFTGVTMSSSEYSNSFNFIGNSSGMFVFTSGYVTKSYDPATDRLIVEAYNSNLTLSSISVKLVVTINSSSYVLPITNNITISLHNTQISVGQDISFLPGSELLIDSDSKLTVGNNKRIYLYDLDNYNTSEFRVIGYTVANGTTTKRTTASLKDAEIDLNGTIKVESGGHLYTTEAGAYIHSSEKSGKITFSSASDTGTIYQNTGTGPNYVSAACVNAILTNGDGSHYVETVVAGEEILYDSVRDKWGKTAQSDVEIHVNFRDRDNNNNSYSTSYLFPSQSFTFPTQNQANFTNINGYKLRRWINDDNQIFSPGDIYEGDFEDGITFYAYYGGWLTNSDNITSYMYKTSNDAETYPYGVATVEKLNSNDAETETYLFDQNGILNGDTKIVYFSSATYPQGDNKYYYFVSGILEKDAGLVYAGITIVPDALYYIKADGTAATNEVRYVGTNSYDLEPGLYEFGADGKLIQPGEPKSISSTYYVKDGTNGSGNTVYGYGLFALTINSQTHLYYGKDDGTIVKNTTFYVKKTNDYFVNGISSSAILIEEGVYYFDNNGYMWYGNNLLEGTNAEYGVIVSGNGVIIGRNNS